MTDTSNTSNTSNTSENKQEHGHKRKEPPTSLDIEPPAKRRRVLRDLLKSNSIIDFREKCPGDDLSIESNDGKIYYIPSIFIIGGPFIVLETALEGGDKALKVDTDGTTLNLALNWVSRESPCELGNKMAVPFVMSLGRFAHRYDCRELVELCLSNLYYNYAAGSSIVQIVKFIEEVRGDMDKIADEWLTAAKPHPVENKADLPQSFWDACYRMLPRLPRSDLPKFMSNVLFIHDTAHDTAGREVPAEVIDAFYKRLFNYGISLSKDCMLLIQKNRDNPVAKQFRDAYFDSTVRYLGLE